jgi:hypothetical protein
MPNQKRGRGPHEEPIYRRKTLRCAVYAELHEETISGDKDYPQGNPFEQEYYSASDPPPARIRILSTSG